MKVIRLKSIFSKITIAALILVNFTLLSCAEVVPSPIPANTATVLVTQPTPLKSFTPNGTNSIATVQTPVVKSPTVIPFSTNIPSPIVSSKPANTPLPTTGNSKVPSLALIHSNNGPSTQKGGVGALAFRADNTMLAVGRQDGLVKLFLVPGGQEVRTLKTAIHSIQALAFSPDGKVLAIAGDGATIQFWSIPDNKFTEHLTVPLKGVLSVIFSPDGKTIAIRGKSTQCANCGPALQLWSISNSKLQDQIEGASDYHINSAAFNPEGTLIAYGILANCSVETPLNFLALTKISPPKLLGMKSELEDIITAVVFNHDGKLLAAANAYLDGTGTTGISIWSMENGQERLKMKALVLDDGLVTWLAFSRDDKLLISLGEDQLIRLWDTKSGQVLYTLPSAQSSGLQVAELSSSGRYLATGYQDGSFKLWELIQ